MTLICVDFVLFKQEVLLAQNHYILDLNFINISITIQKFGVGKSFLYVFERSLLLKIQ